MRWLIKASKSDENCKVLRQFKVKSGPEMCQNIRVCDKTDFFYIVISTSWIRNKIILL